jgi:hypothetical protein
VNNGLASKTIAKWGTERTSQIQKLPIGEALTGESAFV